MKKVAAGKRTIAELEDQLLDNIIITIIMICSQIMIWDEFLELNSTSGQSRRLTEGAGGKMKISEQ